MSSRALISLFGPRSFPRGAWTCGACDSVMSIFHSYQCTTCGQSRGEKRIHKIRCPWECHYCGERHPWLQSHCHRCRAPVEGYKMLHKNADKKHIKKQYPKLARPVDLMEEDEE